MASYDPDRPNIIVITSDDQGAWALGSYDNHEIQTPNLDELASRGLRFLNFFCTSPVCSPARASLLTGLIPSQHGIHDWIQGGNSDPHPVDYLRGLTTFADDFAAANYVCGMIGKWHLGNAAKAQAGYSYWFAYQQKGGNYHGAEMILNGQPLTVPTYLTDRLTDEAVSFVEHQRTRDQPFLLSLNYTAPHSPYLNQHPAEFLKLYEDCAFETAPQGRPHPWLQATNDNRPAQADWRACLIGYFSAITAMDASLGRLFGYLGDNDLERSTLVVYTSDNGFNTGHHGIWGKGNSTFPLNFYDTSTKVPAIFSQPGRVREGKVAHALVSAYDIRPTLLEFAGVPILRTPTSRLAGTSFAPLLEADRRINAQDHVVVHDEYGANRMIRTQKWKYVHRYPYGPHELYDLASDSDETTNLADVPRYRMVIDRLYRAMDDWFSAHSEAWADGLKTGVHGRGQRHHLSDTVAAFNQSEVGREHVERSDEQ